MSNKDKDPSITSNEKDDADAVVEREERLQDSLDTALERLCESIRNAVEEHLDNWHGGKLTKMVQDEAEQLIRNKVRQTIAATLEKPEVRALFESEILDVVKQRLPQMSRTAIDKITRGY